MTLGKRVADAQEKPNEPTNAAADAELRLREGDLRVWWIPQVPMTPFYVSVFSLVEARKLLDVLAQYDHFQYVHRVKPDYCNTGGLSIYEDGEWVDWCDEDGNDFDSYEVRQRIYRDMANHRDAAAGVTWR